MAFHIGVVCTHCLTHAEPKQLMYRTESRESANSLMDWLERDHGYICGECTDAETRGMMSEDEWASMSECISPDEEISAEW